MKIIVIIYFFFSSFVSLGQLAKAHINFTLFIDGNFIKSGVNDAFLTMTNGLSGRDTVKIQYEAGDLIMLESDLKKIGNADPHTKYALYFKYNSNCPDVVNQEYKKEWEGPLLNYRYIIFNVYNYSNKRNYNTFVKREGYGISIECPAYTTVLPTKRGAKLDPCE